MTQDRPMGGANNVLWDITVARPFLSWVLSTWFYAITYPSQPEPSFCRVLRSSTEVSFKNPLKPERYVHTLWMNEAVHRTSQHQVKSLTIFAKKHATPDPTERVAVGPAFVQTLKPKL